MRPISIKVRCIKKKFSKSEKVVKSYDDLQFSYANILDNNSSILSFEANVPLECETGTEYMTDFLCLKDNGEYMVRECVFSNKLKLPNTCKLLDISKNYWLKHGVNDWGIVIEKKK